MYYKCLGCLKTNKPKSETIFMKMVVCKSILCEECHSAMELGQYLASNKGVMRIISKFLDKELRKEKVDITRKRTLLSGDIRMKSV